MIWLDLGSILRFEIFCVTRRSDAGQIDNVCVRENRTDTGFFQKQTARAQTAGDPQVTRQGISEHSWPSMFRSSSTISKSNRFPVVLPLLDCNSVISKPHYSKSFSTDSPVGPFVGSDDHIVRVNCKQKEKCIPPGTSSLATGQSCHSMKPETNYYKLYWLQSFQLCPLGKHHPKGEWHPGSFVIGQSTWQLTSLSCTWVIHYFCDVLQRRKESNCSVMYDDRISKSLSVSHRTGWICECFWGMSLTWRS